MMESMPYCINCVAPVFVGANFCANCGCQQGGWVSGSGRPLQQQPGLLTADQISNLTFRYYAPNGTQQSLRQKDHGELKRGTFIGTSGSYLHPGPPVWLEYTDQRGVYWHLVMIAYDDVRNTITWQTNLPTVPFLAFEICETLQTKRQLAGQSFQFSQEGVFVDFINVDQTGVFAIRGESCKLRSGPPAHFAWQNAKITMVSCRYDKDGRLKSIVWKNASDNVVGSVLFQWKHVQYL